MEVDIKKIYERADRWYKKHRKELIREIEPLARAYVRQLFKRR